MLIPDDMDGEAKKGKKRALESGEELGKKKKKSGTSTKNSTSTPQPLRPVPPPSTESHPSKGLKPTPSVASAELPKGIKKPAPKSSTKMSTKEPKEVKQKPARAAAADFFDPDDLESHLSPSGPPKSVTSKPSPASRDSTLIESKSKVEKTPKAKTILKSSKKAAEPATLDVPVKAKHVKFAAKLSDSKPKRGKALGMRGKKVRSGGKSASAKDRVLAKKVAVK